jgi:hypothetical protein
MNMHPQSHIYKHGQCHSLEQLPAMCCDSLAGCGEIVLEQVGYLEQKLVACVRNRGLSRWLMNNMKSMAQQYTMFITCFHRCSSRFSLFKMNFCTFRCTAEKNLSLYSLHYDQLKDSVSKQVLYLESKSSAMRGTKCPVARS